MAAISTIQPGNLDLTKFISPFLNNGSIPGPVQTPAESTAGTSGGETRLSLVVKYGVLLTLAAILLYVGLMLLTAEVALPIAKRAVPEIKDAAAIVGV